MTILRFPYAPFLYSSEGTDSETASEIKAHVISITDLRPDFTPKAKKKAYNPCTKRDIGFAAYSESCWETALLQCNPSYLERIFLKTFEHMEWSVNKYICHP